MRRAALAPTGSRLCRHSKSAPLPTAAPCAAARCALPTTLLTPAHSRHAAVPQAPTLSAGWEAVGGGVLGLLAVGCNDCPRRLPLAHPTAAPHCTPACAATPPPPPCTTHPTSAPLAAAGLRLLKRTCPLKSSRCGSCSCCVAQHPPGMAAACTAAAGTGCADRPLQWVPQGGRLPTRLPCSPDPPHSLSACVILWAATPPAAQVPGATCNTGGDESVLLAFCAGGPRQ